MVQLAPVPFDVLIGRMFRELDEKRSIFDLPAQRFVKAYPGRDLSVVFRERRASTPFGPAAGPHTQMAQNIALSWLAGGRVIELKTVQVNDAIEVPRPCIDMATVGFNVEWSQELTVAQSLEEYVKGAMLIEMLKASGHRRGPSRHRVRHERRLRPRRHPVGQGARLPWMACSTRPRSSRDCARRSRRPSKNSATCPSRPASPTR